MKRASHIINFVLGFQLMALLYGCGAGRNSATLPTTSFTSTVANGQRSTITQPKLSLQEVPVWTDAFVDSIGINTHLSFEDSSYWSSYEKMKSLLLHSGIRHFRDGPMEWTNPACHCNPINDLGKAGVKGDIILSYLSNQNAVFIQTLLNEVPSVDALEDPNEVNVNGDSNWVVDTRNYVTSIYPAIKKLAPSITVVGPSIAWIDGGQNTYASLGDLSSYMQFGNIHDYPGGRNPGTLGWGPRFSIPKSPNGGANYGSIAASVFVDSSMASAKAPWATETGYGDAPGHTPQNINARYEPRLFLEEWLNGVARTYQYQFVDYGSDSFSDFGLVTSSMSPKRNYYALKAMIALLSDPGSAITASTVNYSIVGADSSVHHLLMQKQDGSLYLAIWIEAEGYNVTSGQLEKIPTQQVSLQFNMPMTSATIYKFGDSGSVIPSSIVAAQNMSMTISDHLQILKLTLH